MSQATPTLSEINIYPLKSAAGISLSSTSVLFSGLAFDRQFMLRTPEGEMVSARRYPKLLTLQVTLRPEGVDFFSAEGSQITLRYPELFENYCQVTVWGTEINAQRCGIEFDQWFSKLLGCECELLFFGQQSERNVSTHPDTPVKFADGYPLLLIGSASLQELNQRCPQKVEMSQFRTNLVIAGTTPYEEDKWKRIRIGSVEFEVAKPCSRCIMTSYRSDTAVQLPGSEPLKTLAGYRRGADNNVYFGQNLIALNEGLIRLNDPLEIIS